MLFCCWDCEEFRFVIVCVESGRVTAEDMVSVRSEAGDTTVEAIDMVLDWPGILPWLIFLVLDPGGPFISGGELAL